MNKIDKNMYPLLFQLSKETQSLAEYEMDEKNKRINALLDAYNKIISDDPKKSYGEFMRLLEQTNYSYLEVKNCIVIKDNNFHIFINNINDEHFAKILLDFYNEKVNQFNSLASNPLFRTIFVY